MILVDANILIYASFSNFEQNERARSWFDQQLNGPARVGLPWAILIAFLRVATHPQAMPNPMSVKQAWHQVEDWLECEPVWIPEPTPRHRETLAHIIAQPDIRGKLIPDAHLAALAIEHGLTMCSADTDFARFSGLRWENPLAYGRG